MNDYYVITPRGQPNYYWAGPTVGFTGIFDSAVRYYTSWKVARTAAELIESKLQKDFPNCKTLVVRKISSELTPCCTCGYNGFEETPCEKSPDGSHCPHWWEELT
jgi:ribosomal protein L37AE/L43A